MIGDTEVTGACATPGSEVEGLPNLGPLSGKVLRRCGILSAGQLRQLGAARAFLQVKKEYGQAPRGLLWALEGAVSDRPWHQVATEERLGLLREVQEIESGSGGDA